MLKVKNIPQMVKVISKEEKLMSNERIVTLKDSLSFEEDVNGSHEKHGLRGHVTIIRENVKTGESGISGYC